MLKTIGKWIGRLILVLIILLVAVVAVAAFTPIETEAFIPDEESGAGVRSIIPSYTGLLRDFPELAELNPDEVELGRQLFFDPILSANNDMSCATCHHPDKGFSDGRPTAVTADGTVLTRNAPTVWNTGYPIVLFHDGRVDSLEEQASTALMESTEMNADPATTETELAEISDYVALFEAAYGADGVSFDNITRALATFQRSLTANNTPFDRYAAGDFDALTSAQRRGLSLFRSGATRCFECHANPTFASDTFRMIGVESDDVGRGIMDDSPDGMFRVPTLRNVALTGPYMHNGSMETLEEVIQFYAESGGRGRLGKDTEAGKEIDVFIQGFPLNEQEKSDLVAFLHALTDESSLPEVPTVALSGLPTIERVENPTRAVAAAMNIGSSGQNVADRAPQELTVQAGETIQSVVDRARPGDTVLIPYGTYHERVVIDISDLTLQGIPNEAGEYPIFDGQKALPEAVVASGNNFTIAYLTAVDYTNNGFLTEGVTGLHMHHLETHNTGTYGIYPVRSRDVLVEHVVASGVNDAAIYAGQSENIIVRNCEVYDSVIGVEIENSINGDVYDCHIYDNSLGILYVVLPRLDSKVSRVGKVYNNIVENNNRINDGPPGSTVSQVPPGTGLLIFGSDNIEVYENEFRGNKTTGTSLFSLITLYSADELDVAPHPENNYLHDNVYENNGYDPDPFVRSLGIPTGDILWDGNGWNNRFDEPMATGGFPPWLPSDSTPTPLARVFYRALQGLLALVG
ncbi:MAG: parallel beta-helix domain-containing protein [Chloroflexota bacterium]